MSDDTTRPEEQPVGQPPGSTRAALPTPAPPGPPRINLALAGGPSTARVITLMAIIGLFAYFNSLHAGYVMDDSKITGEPNLGKPWANGNTGRPIVAITLAINYWLEGTQSRGYHLFNLLVHIAAAVTLFDLLRRTLLLPRMGDFWHGRAGWVALIAALVWMVHPLNTQSVTYTIQRAESMAGLFYLLAIWCYLRGATAESHSRRWYIASVACNILGCGCKELMLALPPLLFLYDRAFLSATTWGAIRQRGWVLAAHVVPPIVHIVLLAVYMAFTAKDSTVGFNIALFTPFTYALAQTQVILHYLRLSFWPVGLTLDYLDWPSSHSIWDVKWTAAGLLLLLVVTGYGLVRNRMWAVPAAGFFLYLAPTSSIVPIQDAAFEHRMYIPLVGVVILTIFGLARLVAAIEKGLRVKLGSRALIDAAPYPAARPAAFLACCLIAILAFLTVLRNEDYGSIEVIYRKNLESRPNNPRVRSTYAGILAQQGKLDEAEMQLREVIQNPRHNSHNHKELIEIMYSRGQVEASYSVMQQLHKQIQHTTLGASLLPLMGQMQITLGKPDEAVATLSEAITKDPNEETAKFYLAVARHQAILKSQDATLAVVGSAAAANPHSAQKARIAQELETLRASVISNRPKKASERLAAIRKFALQQDIFEPHLRLALMEADLQLLISEPNDPAPADAAALLLARAKRFPKAAAMAAKAVAAAKLAGWDADRLALLEERVRLFQKEKAYLPGDLDEFRIEERRTRASR